MAGNEVHAHSREGCAESEWEPLADHLAQVGELASDYAAAFGAGTLGAAAGRLHDIGKCSAAFQAYIRNLAPSPDHSTAGAREALRLYGRFAGQMLAFAIAGHHAGLADGAGLGGLSKRVVRPIPDYGGWEAQAGALPSLNDLTPSRSFRPTEASGKGFAFAFLIRMIFSALVDADRVATRRWIEGTTTPDLGFNSLATLAARLDAALDRVAAYAAPSPVNTLRAEVLARARQMAASPPGAFTLTVPTGGGKTLASLAFALGHARAHGLRRIVYVIPFTSIIEQTADVFRDALGDADVLEHHSAMDWDARLDARDDDEGPGAQRKLRDAAENWAAPVIVTTAVQFFESLFSDRPKRARKLHNLADSVIILDEAQTLPQSLLLPCLAALQQLTANYGASVVLCTATQPALRAMDGFEGGFDIDDRREIAPNPRELYTRLRRVTVERRPGRTDDQEIAARFAEQPAMLCIVNSRRHARELHARIAALDGARHLSTLMCPLHRRAVLAELRAALKDRKPVRVVATALMEAGVDLDFPEVWRAMAGLDSIAQAAGRCNRNGRLDGLGRVVVFEPSEDGHSPRAFRPSIAAFEAIASRHEADLLGLDAVGDYFRELYFTRGRAELDTPGILASIEDRASDLLFPFRQIAADFRIIDDVMAPLIVPWRPAGSRRVDELVASLAWVERPGRLARELALYSVGAPRKVRAALIAAGAAEILHADRFGDTFVRLVNEQLYGQESGLDWSDPTFRASETNLF